MSALIFFEQNKNGADLVISTAFVIYFLFLTKTILKSKAST